MPNVLCICFVIRYLTLEFLLEIRNLALDIYFNLCSKNYSGVFQKIWVLI